MIRFEQVTKRYGRHDAPALAELDLTLCTGELTVLVGPSGCGKTTTLRLINRLEEASAGRIIIDDMPIDDLDVIDLRRGIGYVMQHSGLFPHRTVAENIAVVPRLLGWKRARIRARVDELITLVGLDTGLAGRYPHQLSGGQQQRVGVARALAADPPILLMDEPFAAVDPIVRTRLQDELRSLQARLQKTIVFVTHDIDEAIRLGDRIAIFAEGGRLAQYAPPTDVLAAPADDFVADFLGADRDLKRLALFSAADASAMSPSPVADPGTTDIRAIAQAAGVNWVFWRDADGAPSGWQYLDETAPQAVGTVIGPADSLRKALGAILQSPLGAVPRVDAQGRLDGVLDRAALAAVLA
ncbi:ABC transporter ATP-binding protein [Salinisphaera sp. Q1T1-3]|uniref:ABC transporter ATP-binding protein n=1 Tax=Salinisphaera sp. Q1T1-3 TaxID=2321229 RepID=UPI000E76DAB2|nr:ABC transporter ATP-binding protein [Salinisphaera sp. Q1T1-3]RJS93156.1 ABC transporter ATP-binding protein [Salinisphaera sp. Q1T1-3]